MYCCLFKQKTAYEMRISDWSSDVCSSDLDIAADRPEPGVEAETERQERREISDLQDGREVRARDVIDVGRAQLDTRVTAQGETQQPAGIASLAKRSIDDDPPPGVAPRNASTGSSGQQDALANKEQRRGSTAATEEIGRAQ